MTQAPEAVIGWSDTRSVGSTLRIHQKKKVREREMIVIFYRRRKRGTDENWKSTKGLNGKKLKSSEPSWNRKDPSGRRGARAVGN